MIAGQRFDPIDYFARLLSHFEKTKIERLSIARLIGPLALPSNQKLSLLVKEHASNIFKLTSDSHIQPVKRPTAYPFQKAAPPKPTSTSLVPSMSTLSLSDAPNPYVKSAPTLNGPQKQYTLCSTPEQLYKEIDSLSRSYSNYIALDVEYIKTSPESIPTLVLIQIAYFDIHGNPFAFIIDYENVPEIGKLKSVIESWRTVFVHDGRMESILLKHYLGIELKNVVDTQLVYEYLNGELFAGINKFLGLANIQHPTKREVHDLFEKENVRIVSSFLI